MRYRPILILQTGCKVFTKVIVMGTPKGESQQGFVHGRHMLKTVMMVVVVLRKVEANKELAAALSDFRKAYDPVARIFLFLTLLKFSPAFVAMIRRIYDGTTARFLVDGELLDPLKVESGIRQRCPLAPLLILAEKS